MKLTTDLHLVPRLRISGAVPLFPLYAFILWTGTAAPLVGPYIFGKVLFLTVKKCGIKCCDTICLGNGVCLFIDAISSSVCMSWSDEVRSIVGLGRVWNGAIVAYSKLSDRSSVCCERSRKRQSV